MNRRNFLTTATAGLALPYAAAAQDPPPPAGKIRRAGLIGCGWYGMNDLNRLLQVAPTQVVALCDVDKDALASASGSIAKRQTQTPRAHADYREMLKQKDLDVVIVATPDHWHALIAIAAIQSGADVFLEKPVGVDVIEAQAILAAARQHRRVVQVDLQRRSTPHIVAARDEIIKTGKLGKIALVETYCYFHMRASGNPPDSAPPASLDYEMWTGPAPMRPFNKLTHPRGWRAFMEYGNGIVGDMAVHMFDMTRFLLDLRWPATISSTGGILIDKGSKANITDTQTATFDYEDTKVLWQHRTWGAAPDNEGWGATFYGDKGTLKVSVTEFDFKPAGKGDPIHRDALVEPQYGSEANLPPFERAFGAGERVHMRNFLAAVDARTRPVSDIEEGYISTASCILANLSMKLGRTLAWDPTRNHVAGDPEANRMLARAYRKPWTHPDPEHE